MIHMGGAVLDRHWGWSHVMGLGLGASASTHCTGDSPYQVPPKSGYRSLIPWPSGGLGHQGWSIWVFRCWIVIGGGPTSWGWGWELLYTSCMPRTVPVTHPTDPTFGGLEGVYIVG